MIKKLKLERKANIQDHHVSDDTDPLFFDEFWSAKDEFIILDFKFYKANMEKNQIQ